MIIKIKKMVLWAVISGIAAFFIMSSFFSCDYNHGLHPVPITGIAGTITFRGEWPANTEFVRMVVYRDYPPPSLIAISAIGEPIPLHVKKYDYVLELPSAGTYRWILVVWKAKNALFTDIKTLGTYYETGDSSQPGSVSVVTNRVTRGIDIVADFGVLSPGLETSGPNFGLK